MFLSDKNAKEEQGEEGIVALNDDRIDLERILTDAEDGIDDSEDAESNC